MYPTRMHHTSMEEISEGQSVTATIVMTGISYWRRSAQV